MAKGRMRLDHDSTLLYVTKSSSLEKLNNFRVWCVEIKDFKTNCTQYKCDCYANLCKQTNKKAIKHKMTWVSPTASEQSPTSVVAARTITQGRRTMAETKLERVYSRFAPPISTDSFLYAVLNPTFRHSATTSSTTPP